MLELLSQAPFPAGYSFAYDQECSICVLKDVPLQIGEHQWTEDLLLDTGFDGDLLVREDLWSDMESKVKRDDPILMNRWNPKLGFAIKKNFVQERVTLLNCDMADLSVGPGNLFDAMSTPGRKVRLILGIRGMSQLEIVGDGTEHRLLVRSRSEPAIPARHNRSGADFMPSPTDEKHLVAEVLDNSPAWRMGLRTGDHIIGQDGHVIDDFRNGVFDPDDSTPSLTERIMAGGPLQLRVRRGQEELDLELFPEKP